jgi:hypothetical protein
VSDTGFPPTSCTSSRWISRRFWPSHVSGGDFEGRLQIALSIAANLDAIVTRDPSGFRYSPIRVPSPAEFLALVPRDRPEKSDDVQEQAQAVAPEAGPP